MFLLAWLNLVKLGNCPIIHKFSSKRSAILVCKEHSSNLHGYGAVRTKKNQTHTFKQDRFVLYKAKD